MAQELVPGDTEVGVAHVAGQPARRSERVTATAQAVAAERYLLETLLKRPILVKAAAASRLRREEPS